MQAVLQELQSQLQRAQGQVSDLMRHNAQLQRDVLLTTGISPVRQTMLTRSQHNSVMANCTLHWLSAEATAWIITFERHLFSRYHLMAGRDRGAHA